MKYWFTRITGHFLAVGSFVVGLLVGYEYGLWAGLGSFFTSIIVGIYLHKTAEKMRK